MAEKSERVCLMFPMFLLYLWPAASFCSSGQNMKAEVADANKGLPQKQPTFLSKSAAGSHHEVSRRLHAACTRGDGDD